MSSFEEGESLYPIIFGEDVTGATVRELVERSLEENMSHRTMLGGLIYEDITTIYYKSFLNYFLKRKMWPVKKWR